MRLETAIRTILSAMPQRVFLSANGLISRWAWQYQQGENVVPMLGSMGLAQAIAVGMCFVKPERPVGILNGDGNLLMEPSTTLLAGAQQHLNLVHFCLNNGAYASTGGQPTIARPGLLSDLARIAGYETVVLVRRLSDLRDFCGREFAGPAFCEVVVEPTSYSEPERVDVSCSQITKRARRQMEGAHNGN